MKGNFMVISIFEGSIILFFMSCCKSLITHTKHVYLDYKG